MSEELHLNIQNLHDVLKDYPVDDCTAGTIKQLTNELQLSLARAEGDIIPLEDYNERLEQEAIKFSEEHPIVSGAIRQLINSLSSIGI